MHSLFFRTLDNIQDFLYPDMFRNEDI